MQKGQEKRKIRPPQKLARKLGKEGQMEPEPVYEKEKEALRLKNKTVIITGGDSGIGKAVAIAMAKEGADIVIAYHEDHTDARATEERVKAAGRKCLLIAGDVSKPSHCQKIVRQTLRRFGKIDILVNNAGIQFPQKELQAITEKQLKRTFEVNFFAYLYLVQAADKANQPLDTALYLRVLIGALEESARGIYTGAVGFIDREGGCSLAVAIRTAVVHAGQVAYFAGGGIVADSVPEAETAETDLKAQVFLRAIVEHAG